MTKILQELCALEITSTRVSGAVRRSRHHARGLAPTTHPAHLPPLILDARYEKVRVNGAARSCAVLTAIGIRREDGRRMLLGVSVSEAEVHWREVRSSLQARGLHTCSSITSDAREGLQAAATIEIYSRSTPHLATWMETNLPEGFNVFALPEPIRKRLRTSNLCEALHQRILRRTRVAAIFPNPESCLRLVSAVPMEISESWETSKAYPNPKLVKQSSTTSTTHITPSDFYGKPVA